MNFEKYTKKLQSIVQEAQSLALSKDNTTINSVHFLAVMIGDKATLATLQNAGQTYRYYRRKHSSCLIVKRSRPHPQVR